MTKLTRDIFFSIKPEEQLFLSDVIQMFCMRFYKVLLLTWIKTLINV